MDDPIKVIYKYKNNKRRTQYHFYVFVGNMISPDVAKALRKIHDLNLYDTLVGVSPKESAILSRQYGDKWYLKFFVSEHVTHMVATILSNTQMRKTLEDRYGKDWFDAHIASFHHSQPSAYSFQSVVKSEREQRNRFKKWDAGDEIDFDFSTRDGQRGGDAEEDGDEAEEEEEPAQAEEDSGAEDDEFDVEELQVMRSEDSNMDAGHEKVAELIENVIDQDVQQLRLIAFDESHNDNPYDMLLKNLYVKHFVFQHYIFWDDTVKNIKYKVCGSIQASKVFDKSAPYLIPSRMYMWSVHEFQEPGRDAIKREKVMLGQKWVVRNELLKVDVEPNDNIHVYENLKGNLKHLKENMRKYGSRIKRENDENNILEEYRDFVGNNEIFLIDIYHELGMGYAADAEQLRNLYDVYVKIYFTDITNEDFTHLIEFLRASQHDGANARRVESGRVSTVFHNIQNQLLLESEVMKTVEELRPDKALYRDYFFANHITQTDILVNLAYVSKYGSAKLDIYRIFDNFIVNDEYPFIQYQNMEGKLVFKFFSESSEEVPSKWFENAPYGLSFKVRITHEKLQNNRYLAINLNENGRLEYKTQWKEDDHIVLDDIKRTYDDIARLIDKINGENTKVAITPPKESQYRYAFINTIQQFVLPGSYVINHNDLSDFARYFFPYVTVVIEPRKRVSKTSTDGDASKSKYGTYLRFKRITKYENEARIDHRIIHFLRNYEFVPHILAGEIAKQFNITEKQAMDRITSVRARYPVLKKTRKILKKLDNLPKYKPPGIGIDIQGKTRDAYKIRISGARSKDQLERITSFIHILLYLYVDTYLVKNKDRQFLRNKLRSLTDIAKRRNMVDTVVKQEEDEVRTIKQITKLDKERVGFKPEKGQNQWSRSCQNSGDISRRPMPFTEETIVQLLKKGYVLNKKTGDYEKKVVVKDKGKKKEVVLKAAKLGDIYWTCDPADNKDFMYVGFLSRSNNPNGLCMPCCFKKDPAASKNKQKREYHLRCTGKLAPKDAVAEADEPTIGDKLYILQDTNKMLPNRFGYLPKLLDSYFNRLRNKHIRMKNHYMVASDGYMLKFGTVQEDSPFLQAVASALQMSAAQAREAIVQALTTKGDGPMQLFTSLNNGDIRAQFETIESYLSFLRGSQSLDYELLDDLLCTPGVLHKDGLNVYIIEKRDADYHVLCKNVENMVYFTDRDRHNVVLLKEDKNYYPIVEVSKEEADKGFGVRRTFDFTDADSNTFIRAVWSYFSVACDPVRIGSSNMPSAKHLHKQLLAAGLEVVKQVVDGRHRCKFLVAKDGTPLPVRPSGAVYNLPIASEADLRPLSALLPALADAIRANEAMRPVGVVYDSRDGDAFVVSALKMDETMITLPLAQERLTRDSIDEAMARLGASRYQLLSHSLYEAVDAEISKGASNVRADNRTEAVTRDRYLAEGYHLFCLEVSHYLSENPRMHARITKALEGDAPLNRIKQYLYDILDTQAAAEFKRLVGGAAGSGTLASVQPGLPDLGNYVIRNHRQVCSVHKEPAQCAASPHCVLENKVCKVRLGRDQMLDYVNRLASELVHNEVRRKEVLQADGYYVSDIVNTALFTAREGQRVIKSDNNNIAMILNEVFGKDNVPIIGKRRLRKIEKAITEENAAHALQQVGKVYYQEVAYDYPIVRAYVNGFYWRVNTFASKSVRNLGYYSPLQVQLTNYFRSMIYEWITCEDNVVELLQDLPFVKVHKDEFLNVFQEKLDNQKGVYMVGLVELYILNRIHNAPVVVYDQYDTLLYVLDQGLKHCALLPEANRPEVAAEYEARGGDTIKVKLYVANTTIHASPSKVAAVYAASR
jgi:hypothetical protein